MAIINLVAIIEFFETIYTSIFMCFFIVGFTKSGLLEIIST